MDVSTATEPTPRASVDVAPPAQRAWRLITDLTGDRDGENYSAGWVQQGIEETLASLKATLDKA